MDWLRLYHDTLNDPKWRVIAGRCQQPLHAVLATWMAVLINASQSADRGTLHGWDDEDMGVSLGLDPEAVAAIRQAMQGKVLDGDKLTGWEKRQPKREREDAGSADRVRAWRERQKAASDANETETYDTERHVTPRNASERLDKRREEKKGANAPNADAREAAFEQWWAAYPHKVGKGQAEKAFPRALQEAGSLQVLLDGVRRYVARKPADRNWCNPATWLNGKRWLDDFGPPAATDPPWRLRAAI